MSTYTDVCKKVKESIAVDYHSRITPQEVNFINPKNKFTGEVHVKGNSSIDNAKLHDVQIDGAIVENISFKNGMSIDNISSTFEELSNVLSTALSNGISSIMNLTNTCLKLSLDIIDETARAMYAELSLNNCIYVESNIRHNADQTVLREAKEFTIKNRHLKLNKINDTSYTVKTEDFAINTYKAYSPNGYVFMDDVELPIGRLLNSVIGDDNKYVSFELLLFEGTYAHELTSYGKMLYKFDSENTTIYSHVGGYRIKWINYGHFGLPEFLVDSANDAGFFNAFFEDSHDKAGLVFAKDEDIDDLLNIQKCSFSTTSRVLSNFIKFHPYSLVNGMKTDVKCIDGSISELSLLNNTIYIADGIAEKNYIALSNSFATLEDEIEFGRIFEGGIYTEGQELYDINVDVGGCLYLLNRRNNFDVKLPSRQSSEKHLAFIEGKDENKIKIFEIQQTYKYKFDDADNENIFIPGKKGTDFNLRYADEYEIATVGLNFKNEPEYEFLNREYFLQRKQNSLNLYSCKEIVGELHLIELTFDKITRLLDIFIKRLGSGMTTTIQLRLIFNDPVIETNIKFLAISLEINVFAPVYDKKVRTVNHSYSAKIDVKSGRIGREDTRYSCRIDDGECYKDVVNVNMPNKRDDIPGKFELVSSQFILNFKILDDSKVDKKRNCVQINLIPSRLEDHFFYHNKFVKNIYLIKNTYCSLKFTEIQPHKYMVEDMNDTEFGIKLKYLYDRLSADELSVGNELCSIHSDISAVSAEILTAIHRNRNDVSFFGDVQLSDRYDLFDIDGINHISSLVLTNEDVARTRRVQYGFMFRCKAPAGRQGDMFQIWNDDALVNVNFKDNMYFIVIKRTPDDTVHVDLLRYNDVTIFNNFEIDLARLSSYALSIELSASQISSEVSKLCTEISNDLTCKYDLLTADDKFISSEVDRLCSEISDDVVTKYNDISTTVSSLSNTVSNDFVNRLSDNVILGNNTFVGNVSAVNVSVNNNIVEHLSIDSTNLKLTDRLSTLDEELSDLEAKTDFLLSVGHRSMEYFNEVKSIKYVSHENADLVDWLKDNFGNIPELSSGLKHGFMFRLSAEQQLYKPGSVYPYVVLNENDYFIAKHDIRPLEKAKFEDFAIIYDAKAEGKDLCTALSIKIDELELSASQISSEVNRLCSEISNDLTAKYELLTADDSFISSEVSRLCTEISNDLTAKYELLAVDDSFISSEVSRLCTEISNDLSAKYSWLSGEIKANNDEIKYLSSELSDYHNTLSGIDRKEHEPGDIYTDNLMITSIDKIDESSKHKKYYLTMLSGTLVLKEITE